LAAASLMVARSTPSSSAHRSSGAAIGRPRSRSCQVPTGEPYRTLFEIESGNLAYHTPVHRSEPHRGHLRATNHRIAADNKGHCRPRICSAHRAHSPPATGGRSLTRVSDTDAVAGSMFPNLHSARPAPGGGARGADTKLSWSEGFLCMQVPRTVDRDLPLRPQSRAGPCRRWRARSVRRPIDVIVTSDVT
jgi:hypothetical protein